MKFNEKLQQLRKEQSITQEELAERLEVSRQSVSKWEAGQNMPEIDKIIELAKMFGVSLDYLLTEAEENPPHEEREAPPPPIVYLPAPEIKQSPLSRSVIIGLVFFVAGLAGIMYCSSEGTGDIPLFLFCALTFIGLVFLVKDWFIRQNMMLKLGIPMFPISFLLSGFTIGMVYKAGGINFWALLPLISLALSVVLLVTGIVRKIKSKSKTD